jgi:hypothetical protein
MIYVPTSQALSSHVFGPRVSRLSDIVFPDFSRAPRGRLTSSTQFPRCHRLSRSERARYTQMVTDRVVCADRFTGVAIL